MERDREGRGIDVVILVVLLLMLFALITVIDVQLDKISVQVNDLQTRVYAIEQEK